MKALRIIAIVAVAIVAIAVLVVLLALTPAFQTWAVRKAVANQPGTTLDVARVAAGFSSANLDGVRLVKNGVVITARHVVAKYSAWDYISHRRINVDDFTVEDLVVDARAARASATASPPGSQPTSSPTVANAPASRSETARHGEPNPTFNGILNQIQLPFDVRIAHFSLPGKALLPNDRTATFEVHGSDVTTGQRGTVDWKFDLTDATADAAIKALHSTGTALVHITTERRIDVLELHAVAAAEGSKLPADQVKLEAKVEQPAAGGNEGYNATVSLVRGGSAEQLLDIAGHYDAAARQVSGAWKLNIRTEQVAALLNGLGMPEVAAQGSGNFTANPDGNAITANGELIGDLSRLEKLSPELASIGRLHVQTKFEGGVANNIANVASLNLDATTADGRRLVEVNTLQRIGYSLADKRVTFADAKAELARIAVHSLPLAWVQPFARPVKIDSGEVSMVLAIAAEADGSHVRITPVEPLTVRNLTVRQGDQKLADQLNLSVKPQADYSQDNLRAELNDLTVTQASGDTVNGRFTVDITHVSKNPSTAFTADTQAKFIALLRPYLKADTGPLTVASKSEGTMTGQTLAFATSTTRVTRSTGQPVVSIDLLQPLSINLQTNRVTTANADAETLRVALGEIPLSWAQGFIPNSKFDGRVTGGTIGVTVRSLDDVAANATQPITLRGATVAMNDQPMLQNVDVTADFTATKRGPVVTYNVRRMEARQGTTTLLNLAISGDAKLGASPTVVAKGTLAANVTGLVQQPMLASSATLSRGDIRATFDLNLADALQAKANVTASDLVAKQGNRPIGTAVLDVTATVQPDGASTVHMPFTLANTQRRSDATLDGKVSRAGGTFNFEGHIVSNQLFIDDVTPLASLAPTPPPANPDSRVAAQSSRNQPPATPASTPSTAATSSERGPATQPFWAVANGKIDLDLREITYGRDYVITGVRGSATLAPTQLAINADGRLKENAFKIGTTVDFEASQPQPYTVNGQADIPGFEVGAFLQASNPNEKPMLETTVNIKATFTGRGTSLMDAGKNTYGTFDFTGGKGVLRALGQSKVGQAAGIVSGLGALAGALTGKQEISAGADLVGIFSEIPFDRFLMHAERGADLNLKVTNLEFIGPEVRITGNGMVQNQPNVPVSKQPMQLTLQFAAKGNVAQVLKQRNLISAEPDPEGYFVMNKSFTIGGTAAKSDATSLWSILLGAGTDLLRGFLGK